MQRKPGAPESPEPRSISIHPMATLLTRRQRPETETAHQIQIQVQHSGGKPKPVVSQKRRARGRQQQPGSSRTCTACAVRCGERTSRARQSGPHLPFLLLPGDKMAACVDSPQKRTKSHFSGVRIKSTIHAYVLLPSCGRCFHGPTPSPPRAVRSRRSVLLLHYCTSTHRPRPLSRVHQCEKDDLL